MKRVFVPNNLAGAGLAAALAACGLPQSSEAPADLNGPWVVQQIAGASLGEGVDVYMEINAETGAITGFTGCNRFQATMTAFTDSLAIGAIQEEPGECASAAAATDEARFLGVLGSVQRYVRRGKSLELLPRDHGEALLRLRVDDFGTLMNPAAGPTPP